MTEPTPRKSDLGVRVVSAVVMVVVAASALWLGGSLWVLFVGLIALGVLWEWRCLTLAMTTDPFMRLIWLVAGVLYIGVSALALAMMRDSPQQADVVATVILAVIATDIGAYFAGRTIGGPKIAPAISPSKTWSGLAGGMLAAALVVIASTQFVGDGSVAPEYFPIYAMLGALIAVIAQVGDFFESWMKRRARVKDSGALIPGHGGLFDRVDGLLAVTFCIGLYIIFIMLLYFSPIFLQR